MSENETPPTLRDVFSHHFHNTASTTLHSQLLGKKSLVCRHTKQQLDAVWRTVAGAQTKCHLQLSFLEKDSSFDVATLRKYSTKMGK